MPLKHTRGCLFSKRCCLGGGGGKRGCEVLIVVKPLLLLYIGVRNKYCHACATGKKSDHICYRNWNASSSEMETDIILEGFLEAERVHGVRYTEFIGGW